MSGDEHAISTVNAPRCTACRHFCERGVFEVPKQIRAFCAAAFAVAMTAVGVQVAARAQRQWRNPIWVRKQHVRGRRSIDQPEAGEVCDLVVHAIIVFSQVIELPGAKPERAPGVTRGAL